MLIPLLLALQAAVSPLVPQAGRPDTDGLNVIIFTVPVIDLLFGGFYDSDQSEQLVCLYGVVIEPDTVWLLEVTEAEVEAAGPKWVKPVDEFCEPRDDFMGFAHSHPRVFAVCNLSGRDVAMLDRKPIGRRALFGMVFCANGEMEWVWQDGRIERDNWMSWYEDEDEQSGSR